mmetsp:Transcript_9742/g.19716  ORF Transcript_9742/g.19716 Transcript_9742/m.19716 type:complete len:867 (-) Transcript_9742:49-2649(-)
MAKSKKKTAPPAPPLPPWQRLHKPVAPPKTAEEIAAEKAAADAAKDEVPPAAAAAGVPTDLPSDEPNQTKHSGDATNSNDIVVPPLPPLKSNDSDKDSISGEINDISTIPPSSKNKKKGGPPGSKKSHGDTIDSEEEDSDDEPIFKDFKAVKCPRTSVSAEAYAKRLREGEKGTAAAASGATNEEEMPPLPPLRRGTRDRGGKGVSLNNEASADDIDALAISVAESSESFDIAAAVAKMPSTKKKKKTAAKSKASPKKKGGSTAKAPKKTAAKSAAKKPAAVPAVSTTTPAKRSSTRLNALENGPDEEETPSAASSPQRASRRQRTQVVPFTVTDAPASSPVHGEYISDEQQVASPAKKSGTESKKRKSVEPAAGAKAKKVGKKEAAPKKPDVALEDDPMEDDEAYLPTISSPRAQHVTAKMEATWNERMTMLKDHKTKYGTTDLTVAERSEVNQLLRSFVFEQRKQHKKYMSGKHSSLTAERIKELSDMGFEFDPMTSGTHKANNMRRFQEQWNGMYDELVQFKNEHGHTLVPLGKKAKEELKKLGNWVRGQRKSMNKVGREKFDSHRLAKLEAIGFDWNPLASGTYTAKKRLDLFPRVNTKWMEWYNKLKGFKEKHGHIIVGPTTKNYPGLYNWIHGQRKEYVKYQKQEPNANMYEEWIKLLNDLGFDWAPMSKGGNFSDMLKKRPSSFFEGKWDSHYKDLCKFHEENGHCYVFRNGDNTTLAGWVHCQRKQKKLLDDGKHSQLNQQRIELLNKIGFDWRPSESGGIERLRSPERNLEWDQLFEKLKEYKEQTGHCSPKKKVPKIGNWVSGQRRLWARNQKGETTTLTEERVAKLQSIGFEFTSANDESASAEDDFSVYSDADC